MSRAPWSDRRASPFAGRLLDIHDALDAAGLAHAFGGAVALGYCTQAPRTPRDLDINVFVPPSQGARVLSALPGGVTITPESLRRVEQLGEVKLPWEDTVVHAFLDVLRFHDEVARAVRLVPFADRSIPVVGCTQLVIFKALLNRTQDWVDIEAMLDAGSVDLSGALAWISEIAGADSAQAQRMGTFRPS